MTTDSAAVCVYNIFILCYGGKTLKKRITALFTAAVFVLLSFVSALPAFVVGESGTRYATPDRYNDHDYQAVVSFLEIEDGNGVKNGEKLCERLGTEYDPEDPRSWSVYNERLGISIGMVFAMDYTQEHRLQMCLLSDAFEGAEDPDMMPCGELDLSNNPYLPFDMIGTDGEGTIGTGYTGGDRFVAAAYGNEGYHFAEWRTEDGEFISDEHILYADETDAARIVAVFEQDEIIPGDVNGDGTVDMTDALLVMRAVLSLIEFSPEQMEAAEMNGDGEINMADALLILRMSLGLRGE